MLMLTAVLTAVLPYLIWIANSYRHQLNQLITNRVRLAAGLMAMAFTIAICCNLADIAIQLLEENHQVAADQEEQRNMDEQQKIHRLISLLGGPENYLHFLELQSVKNCK